MKRFLVSFALVICTLSTNYIFAQSIFDILGFAYERFENPIIFVPIKDNPIFAYSTNGAHLEVTQDEIDRVEHIENVSFFKNKEDNTLEYLVFVDNSNNPTYMIVPIPNEQFEEDVALWLFNFMNWAEAVGGTGLDHSNIENLLKNDEYTWKLFMERVQVDSDVLEYAKKQYLKRGRGMI